MYMFVFLREYCLCMVIVKTKKTKVSEIRPQNIYTKYAFTLLLTNGCSGLEFFLHNDLKIILLIVHIKL